jgi:hypothetical protein
MILDFEIQLQDLESQPVWIEVDKKINQLKNRKQELLIAFDKYENEKVLALIENVDKDIQLFKNIIAFWALNYSNLEKFKADIQHNIEANNNGAQLLQQIDDLRMIWEHESKLNIDLSELILLKFQEKDIKDSLSKLKLKSNEYYKLLVQKIKEITNE